MTGPTKPVKRDDAVSDPKTSFETPMQVVETPALKVPEKKRALETWEEDEKALQRASEEGMGGGQPPRLHEVKKAAQVLEEKLDDDKK